MGDFSELTHADLHVCMCACVRVAGETLTVTLVFQISSDGRVSECFKFTAFSFEAIL